MPKATNQFIKLYRGQERGRTRLDWLDSYHSFSFGEFHDPARMGFRALRVINDDKVAPGQGFGEHPHRDMEIITYVTDGELKHQDSLGHGSVIKAGCVQKMSAGTGIRHSEFNASKTKPVHLFQIWIIPDRRGLPPSYEEFNIDTKMTEGLFLLASPEGGEKVITIHQDVRMFLGRLSRGKRLDYSLADKRGLWIQMIKGKSQLNEQPLQAGDGASVEDVPQVIVKADENSEFLMFDAV